ncbi:MAG: TonB-dependent receptor domain-containing protein, partial [Gemmatimonadota bacterium]
MKTLTRAGFAAGWFALTAFVGAPSVVQAQVADDRVVVRGNVVAEDGTPLPAAQVEIEGRAIQSLTGDDGSFLLERVPRGRHVVRAKLLGYGSTSVPVVVGDETETLRIVMTARPIELRAVTAIGTRTDLEEVRARMREIPGSVALIEREAIETTRQANFHDVLRYTPGVFVQPRFGAADESQISIRGSGLRNNFHLRGLNILVNGMPYRNADGFTDFESLELATAEDIQVYKGANALRYGGSTLGGAVNIETRSGHTADDLNAFAQGGSYGFYKSQLSSGMASDNANFYVSYVRTGLDGYREHADQLRDRVNAHVGAALGDNLDLRAFYLFAHVDEDLPGNLTADEFAADPTLAAENNVINDWGRDYTLHHVGTQLRAHLGEGRRIDVAPYAQLRDIVHPIFQVIDQESRDFGLEVRYEQNRPLGGRDNRLTLGFQPAWGSIDNKNFENVGGESGELRKDQDDTALGLGVYAENALDVTDALTAIIGLRYDRAVREVDDDFLDDGDQSDRRVFTAWQPRLGVLFDLDDRGTQLFANASRSFEPPLLLELNSLAVPGFIDLEAQDAWQFEIGTRGRRGPWQWELALYDVELRDEIHNVNVEPFPGAGFTVPTYRNSERSRHYGLEAGFGYTLPHPIFSHADGGDELTIEGAWTFARNRYVDDEVHGNNDIPGAPEHIVQARVRWRHPNGLSVAPNLEWVPGSYHVNSENTVENRGWTVLG